MLSGCKWKACSIHLNQSGLIALVYSVAIIFSEHAIMEQVAE